MCSISQERGDKTLIISGHLLIANESNCIILHIYIQKHGLKITLVSNTKIWVGLTITMVSNTQT